MHGDLLDLGCINALLRRSHANVRYLKLLSTDNSSWQLLLLNKKRYPRGLSTSLVRAPVPK